MLLFKDIVSDGEVVSDVWPLKEVDGMFYETDCREYFRGEGQQEIHLEGANAAQDPDPDDPDAVTASGGDGDEMSKTKVYNIEDDFQMIKIDDSFKPSKKEFEFHLKKWIKKVPEKMKEKGKSEEEIDEFKRGAGKALKKVLGNYDNYSLLQSNYNQQEEYTGQYVMIDYREDGMTPFATIWKHGLYGEKL